MGEPSQTSEMQHISRLRFALPCQGDNLYASILTPSHHHAYPYRPQHPSSRTSPIQVC